MSRYAPDSKFPPSPACFASPSGYTRLLGPRTLFLGSPQRSASIGAPLAPTSALVASGYTMSSSSPTSTSHAIASSPELCLPRSLRLLKALKDSFPTITGATWEVRSLSGYVPDADATPSPACLPPVLGLLNLLGIGPYFRDHFNDLLHLAPLSRLQVRSLFWSPPWHPPSLFRPFPLSQHALCSVWHVFYGVRKPSTMLFQ